MSAPSHATKISNLLHDPNLPTSIHSFLNLVPIRARMMETDHLNSPPNFDTNPAPFVKRPLPPLSLCDTFVHNNDGSGPGDYDDDDDDGEGENEGTRMDDKNNFTVLNTNPSGGDDNNDNEDDDRDSSSDTDTDTEDDNDLNQQQQERDITQMTQFNHMNSALSLLNQIDLDIEMIYGSISTIYNRCYPQLSKHFPDPKDYATALLILLSSSSLSSSHPYTSSSSSQVVPTNPPITHQLSHQITPPNSLSQLPAATIIALTLAHFHPTASHNPPPSPINFFQAFQSPILPPNNKIQGIYELPREKHGQLATQFNPQIGQAIALEFPSLPHQTLNNQQYCSIFSGAVEIIQLYAYKLALEPFFIHMANQIAPNLTALISASLAAQFILCAKGLQQLASTSAHSLSSFGTSKRSRVGYNGNHNHHGFILDIPLIREALGGDSEKKKKRALRLISNKIILAARADSQGLYTNGSYGVRLYHEIQKKLTIFQQINPYKRIKALPLPNQRQVLPRHITSRIKAKLQPSQLTKYSNMVRFGFEEDGAGGGEVFDEFTGVGYGLLGRGQGSGSMGLNQQQGLMLSKLPPRLRHRLEHYQKINDAQLNAFPLLFGLKQTQLVNPTSPLDNHTTNSITENSDYHQGHSIPSNGPPKVVDGETNPTTITTPLLNLLFPNEPQSSSSTSQSDSPGGNINNNPNNSIPIRYTQPRTFLL